MHDAVCKDIVNKSQSSTTGKLYKTKVKIVYKDSKGYGLADIRSEDGYVWEVKRVTCSIKDAFEQLGRYLNGTWKTIINSLYTDTQPKRGDNRLIMGIVQVDNCIGFYANVGNGYILYEYIELPNNEILNEQEAELASLPAKEKVRERAPSFNPMGSRAVAPLSGVVLIPIMFSGLPGGGNFMNMYMSVSYAQ